MLSIRGWALSGFGASLWMTRPQTQVMIPAFGFRKATGSPCALSVATEPFQVEPATISPDAKACSMLVSSAA